MIKFFLKFILILTVLAASGNVCNAQNIKIGSVDLKKLFDQYWKTQQAIKQLQTQRDETLKEHSTITNLLLKGDASYKTLLEVANDQAVSAEEREKRKKDAENKLLELRQLESRLQLFNRSAENTLQETKNRMMSNIMTELKNAIVVKSKADGYALMIDSSAESQGQVPIFLYSNLQDITEELNKQINATAPRGFLDNK